MRGHARYGVTACAAQAFQLPGAVTGIAGVCPVRAPPQYAASRSQRLPRIHGLWFLVSTSAAAIPSLYSALACRQHLQPHWAITTSLNLALLTHFTAPLMSLAHKNQASYTRSEAKK